MTMRLRDGFDAVAGRTVSEGGGFVGSAVCVCISDLCQDRTGATVGLALGVGIGPNGGVGRWLGVACVEGREQESDDHYDRVM